MANTRKYLKRSNSKFRKMRGGSPASDRVMEMLNDNVVTRDYVVSPRIRTKSPFGNTNTYKLSGGAHCNSGTKATSQSGGAHCNSGTKATSQSGGAHCNSATKVTLQSGGVWGYQPYKHKGPDNQMTGVPYVWEEDVVMH